MGNTADFKVRGASPQDAEAVSALLEASYPSLMALGYEPTLFARALPLLTKANPVRRQRFWDRRRLNLREALAHLGLMLRGLSAVAIDDFG
jgi:hypothetical protein